MGVSLVSAMLPQPGYQVQHQFDKIINRIQKRHRGKG
jgi:hypothetical protein